MTALIAAAAALLVSAAPLPAGPPLLLGPPLWWRDDGPGGARAEYVFLRKQFVLEEFAPTSASATVEITAQPTWSSVGDAGNLPKLLGAYKLAINGALVAAGPGRSRDGELGVDRIHDVSSLLVVGANVVTVAGFHADDNNTSAGPWMPGASVPGIAFGMRIDTGDAAARNTTTIRTDDSWSAFNAQRVYNPTGNAGCGWYRDPQEYLNMSAMPPHWPSSSEEDVKQQRDDWRAVAVQPAFAQPLKPKATRHIPVLRVAARLTKRGPGHYLIDLGREIQGGITANFHGGKLGVTVDVGYGEESHDDEINPPTPHGSTLPGCRNCTVRCCPMRTTNVFHSVWTLRDGVQTCSEHEYKEFRYAEILLSDPTVELVDVEGWLVRYPLSTEDLVLTSPPQTGSKVVDASSPPHHQAAASSVYHRKLRPQEGLASWSSSNKNLDRVWELCVYTLISATLDTSTDSNTRQRSTCHIDMLVANLGLLNLVAERAMVTHNTALMLQADSDILDGWADFKAATVYSMHHAIMYAAPGDDAPLQLARETYTRLQLFSLINFLDPALGLLNKPAPNVPGLHGCGATPCAGDLIDWPPANRDNYTFSNISTVPNAYAVKAISHMSDVARWLGEADDAARYKAAALQMRSSMTSHLWNSSSGLWLDGLNVTHSAVHSSIIAAASGVVTEDTMATAVLKALERRGLFTGRVLTTCWIAGATLEAVYALGRVSTSGLAAELGLSYMSRSGHRSWIAMMDEWNATMTMEAWSPVDNPGSTHTGMEGITFSHPWCSAPAHVIPRLLLGVEPVERGWTRLRIQPQPGSLVSANFTMPVPAPMPGHADGSDREEDSSSGQHSSHLNLLGVSFRQTASSFTLELVVPSVLNSSKIQVCLPPPMEAPGGSGCGKLVLGDDGATASSTRTGRFLCLARDLVGSSAVSVTRVATSCGED